jgi:hypothetical protein
MKTIFKVLAAALLVGWVPICGPARAAMSLVTPQTCTADQLLACVNGVISGVNSNAQTCTAAGCASPLGLGAPPVITGTCSTAGGGTSAMGLGANNDHGRVTCTSTANTTATLTWATGRQTQPTCIITGETTPVLTVPTNSTIALSWTYASTASPIFDYECVGQ